MAPSARSGSEAVEPYVVLVDTPNGTQRTFNLNATDPDDARRVIEKVLADDGDHGHTVALVALDIANTGEKP